MPQDKFEPFICKWRPLDDEEIEGQASVSSSKKEHLLTLARMSGDSSNESPQFIRQLTYTKKKHNDGEMFIPEHTGNLLTVPGAAARVNTAPQVVITPPTPIVVCTPEEKQECIKRDKNSTFQDSLLIDDTLTMSNERDCSDRENETISPTTSDQGIITRKGKEKLEDNVDSVFLRSTPTNKVRSTPTNVEEEDCGMRCLYCTVRCCECAIM